MNTTTNTTTAKLFINHDCRVISDNEMYCLHNEDYFGNKILTMYPISTSEVEEYLKKGYLIITSNIFPRESLNKNSSLEEKLNWTYQMGEMLITYGELPVSPVGMVIGEEYTLDQLIINYACNTYVVRTSPAGYSEVTYKYVGEKNVNFRLNRKNEPGGYYVTL